MRPELLAALKKLGAPRCPECRREWTTFGHRDGCSLAKETKEPKR